MHTILLYASFPVWTPAYILLSFRVNCAKSVKKKQKIMMQFGDRLTSFSPSESIVLKANRRKKIMMQISLPRLGCVLMERVYHVGKSYNRKKEFENPFGIPREIRNKMALWEQDVPRMSQHCIKVSS
ncbi:hypothetical protein CDAR_127881 [Caerostris darwini]|uniref:Uncharacterized protein n=1 Tax=Caerostris darwini TaxID=1538125 RepID=A0AAV4PLV5_9ARAC|nr:hypothetical protein CDAR_127881 [Caerostris darwini]